MSVSQRISRKTKQKLDDIQAKFVLERIGDQKMNLPELIDQMAEFAEDHFEQFKQKVAKGSKSVNNDATGLPAFLQMTIETDAAGSPDDYKEYDYDDI
ncbi:MAG: hypothetical protein JW839_23180 [Candidatus Lokiarchaeota archaeon]|nr:hypothetical protein [Candidatus Lokiarchaeota archaeon]